MRMGILVSAIVSLAAVAWHADASAADAEPAARTEPVRDLAPLVVTGVQPGPGMWKVHGPGGHTLWVLGTVSPLPGALQWKSDEVEAVIARSGVVLGAPSLQLNADIGFFRGMALLPAALNARKNPDGARLDDILSDAQYKRWSALKERYLGREWGIERWRPMFAAEKLFHASLEEHGMRREVVASAVSKAARASGREVTPVVLTLTIEEPRNLLKDMKRSDLGDAACLDRTMTTIERHMPALAARANAWSTGDTGALAQLPGPERDCLMVLFDTEFVRRRGVGDIPQQMRDTWLAAAETALTGNETSFAVLSMDHVLAEDGYLAALAARGYRVEAP